MSPKDMADQQKQQLKRERVSLEHDIDQKLLALCKIDMSRDIETGVHAVEGDIEALLQALQKVCAVAKASLDPPLPPGLWLKRRWTKAVSAAVTGD